MHAPSFETPENSEPYTPRTSPEEGFLTAELVQDLVSSELSELDFTVTALTANEAVALVMPQIANSLLRLEQQQMPGVMREATWVAAAARFMVEVLLLKTQLKQSAGLSKADALSQAIGEFS